MSLTTRQKHAWLRSTAVAVVLSVAALLAITLAADAAVAAHWKRAPRTHLDSGRMYGVGVADPNNDGYQDIFTTNHKFPSSFLQNTGGHGFTNISDRMRLGPDGKFPGLNMMRPPKDMSEPGVYVWPHDVSGSSEGASVNIVSVGVAVQGRLRTMGRKMTLRDSSASVVTLSRDDDDRPVADFTLEPGGRIKLLISSLSDLPAEFRFSSPPSGDDPGADPGEGHGDDPGAEPPVEEPPVEEPPVEELTSRQIFVGAYAVHPDSLDFSFKLRDRHSLAFADIAGTPDQDVFVETGGLGGGIADPRYLGLVNDQLLISGDGSYSDSYDSSGLYKGRCRGRQSSWSDYDNDGLLDLLSSCEGDYLQLYRQTAPAQFAAAPAPRAKADIYRWMQLDAGGAQELVASTSRGLEAWSYRGGVWQRTETVPSGRDAVQIALADFDNSGSEDVMVTTANGRLVMLENKRGKLRLRKSGKLGLPTGKVRAASFVDYDNDGDQDVSTAPFGIYAQGRHGGFHRTGQLRLPDQPYAILQWLDYNNDGRRDPLVATQAREFAESSKIIFRRNSIHGGRSLELDIEGAAGNREAVGAKVEIHYRERVRVGGKRHGKHHHRRFRRKNRTQTQWVGQNDDSRYSQGHYRVYFGIGRARRVKRVVISWPGGQKQTLHGVRANRLLRVKRS